MKEWIDRAPGMFAVGTASVLLLTVLHELGYFLIVGFQFQSLLSVSDYFANSILWLPYFFVFLLVGVVWGEITRPKNEITSGPSLRTWGFCLLGVGVLILMFDFLTGVAILAALGIITVFLSVMGRNKNIQDQKVLRWMVYLGLTVPVLGAFVFLNGVEDGRNDLKIKEATTTLHVKGETADEAVDLLRTFDRGVLVLNPASGRIEMYRWEDIQKISTPVPVERSSWERRPLCLLRGQCK